jgi:putrescine transport system substrate-binding protein
MMGKYAGAVLGIAVAVAIALVARADEERLLNVYNWPDYIGEHTAQQFETMTGIKVNYDVYDSNETFETKLLAGHTGYDIVVSSGSFLGKQVRAGLFAVLDKRKLPNLKYMDPSIMRAAAELDPDNAHSVPYFWGTIGLGYNVKKIEERMANAPVDSLDLLFKPELAKKFADCGIAMLDSPADVLEIALHYLGRSPYSAKKEDYEAAQTLLMKVRPYIKYFHSSRYIEDMANGKICLALGWNGDFLTARDRASEAKSGIEIQYRIPKEGTEIWIDNLAIPADAPHPNNALAFINFLMDPQIAAADANAADNATPDTAARPYIKPALRDDPNLYPPPDVIAKLFPDKPVSPAIEQLRVDTWTRIKGGS